MNRVRDRAEEVRPKDEEKYDEEEDPDSIERSEEAMVGEWK